MTIQKEETVEDIILKNNIRQRLLGRKVLITGSSRGIGRAIAMAVAVEGADVVIHFNKNANLANEVAEKIQRLGHKSICVQGNIESYDETMKLKEEIQKKFGKIDTLINNAGINVDGLFVNMSKEQWDQVINTNLTGIFNCTKVFIDDLLESGKGRIINISSIVGEMGNVGQVNYAASKAGIIGFTKALAKELARKNITVNAVAPGFILTDMLANVPDKIKEKILAQIPMQRFGTPEDVAYAVVFLASDAASYVTGHVLNVNGGMYV